MIKNNTKIKLDSTNDGIIAFVNEVKETRPIEIIRHIHGQGFTVGQRTNIIHRLKMLAAADYLDMDVISGNKTIITPGSIAWRA